MFYIHSNTCISPQQTFNTVNLQYLNEIVENKLTVKEPEYTNIPTGILRRMGKAVRIGVGSALPLLQASSPNGIIIGTANGGMEDCIKFLNQIIQYNEGVLTPTNFVQSTVNAIAGQLGLLNNNKGYNITHVHRGLAFENAIIDAAMMLKEYPLHNYLLGGVDEISSYNYNIEYLNSLYKNETVSTQQLYTTKTIGTIAGEGAAMFLVNNIKTNATAQLQAILTLHSTNEETIKNQLILFLANHLSVKDKIDIFISGENGDNRLLKYYTACETVLDNNVTITRFKHMVGEYTSSSAFAMWLACNMLKECFIPQHLLKNKAMPTNYDRVLIYNNYKGLQHSFMLINKP